VVRKQALGLPKLGDFWRHQELGMLTGMVAPWHG
jgi:hypothetical protein